MSQELVIETKDLTKVYDGTTVVDHLNLRVAKNKIFGLLSPNGAGFVCEVYKTKRSYILQRLQKAGK